MEGTPETEIPHPPVQAEAQTTPAITDGTPVALSKRGSQDFLGQDFAADMSRLVQEEGNVVLNRIAAAAVNTAYTAALHARDRAESRLEAEQERSRELAAQAASANQRAAVLQERLNSAQESASLRNVFYALGGTAIGLIPFAYETGAMPAALVTIVFGLVLLMAAFFIRPKPAK